MFSPCYDNQYLFSFHLDEDERAGCFTLNVFLMSCDWLCSMAHLQGTVDLQCVIVVFLSFLRKHNTLNKNVILPHILNHTSNAKSNITFDITYSVSSIVTQFYIKKNKTLIYESESRTSLLNHSLLIIT